MAKAIMVQGTASNAGKSFLCAALCRIFTQDGYRVAPFKSQNMALNSFITSENLEMGRAQVMQAEAARQIPSVRMNPILLKPTGDQGSQLIVNGRVRGNFTAQEYFAMKRSLIPDVTEAYQSLARENDIIVIEGAGSPAEINLGEDGFVNMGMAKLADAPVLLCGDIDRGGVFAALYGTVALLKPEDQARICGLVINKFRGDPDILLPGLAMLEDLTGKPVFGVVPYLHLDLDDEDSLTERFSKKETRGLLDFAVLRLPRISNFTDFNPLDCLPEVNLRYVGSVSELGAPDVIFLPGTKNTMDDLHFLRESGLEAAVCRHAAQGGAVVGICGGYQILGSLLRDPEGVEAGGELRGMGLLPAETVFLGEKTRTQVRGEVRGVGGIFEALRGARFSGYEIHMGETASSLSAFSSLCYDGGEKPDGLFRDNIFGTYVHGLFDDGGFTRAFVNCVLRSKGLAEGTGSVNWADYKEKQYDLLADGVRASLDLPGLYRLLGE
ncbi:MAG: cobyric acid synthase [Oscillospiraceae bacterium]|nr:cobyric acid synthase [Oscillospiraceae bacterium]